MCSGFPIKVTLDLRISLVPSVAPFSVNRYTPEPKIIIQNEEQISFFLSSKFLSNTSSETYSDIVYPRINCLALTKIICEKTFRFIIMRSFLFRILKIRRKFVFGCVLAFFPRSETLLIVIRPILKVKKIFPV